MTCYGSWIAAFVAAYLMYRYGRLYKNYKNFSRVQYTSWRLAHDLFSVLLAFGFAKGFVYLMLRPVFEQIK
jgi:hypothetical protein